MLKLSRSNGYFDNHLLFSDDIRLPEGNDIFPFYGFDANLKVTELRQSDTPAAQYYFTPELGRILWYHMLEREFLPKELWHLAGCT